MQIWQNRANYQFETSLPTSLQTRKLEFWLLPSEIRKYMNEQGRVPPHVSRSKQVWNLTPKIPLSAFTFDRL